MIYMDQNHLSAITCDVCRSNPAILNVREIHSNTSDLLFVSRGSLMPNILTFSPLSVHLFQKTWCVCKQVRNSNSCKLGSIPANKNCLE